MPDVTRAALREEGGFTLVELLVAAMIGTVVLFAAFSLVDVAVTKQAETENRLDATQRGRLAMEQVSRALRSQVCPGKGLATMVDAEPTKATFYSYLASAPPATGPIKVERRQLTFEPVGARGRIRERVWFNTSLETGGLQFNAVPDRDRIVATNLSAQAGTPVFEYAKYNPASSPELVWLGQPIAETDKALIVQIRTRFTAWPAGARLAQKVSVPLDTKVFIRTADPTDPEHSPKCI